MWFMETRPFRETCRVIREKMKLSQAEVATLAGLSQTYYSEIERGVKEPGRDAIVRLCKALGLPEDETLFNAGYLPLSAVDVARNPLEAALLTAFRAGDDRARRAISALAKEFAAG